MIQITLETKDSIWNLSTQWQPLLFAPFLKLRIVLPQLQEGSFRHQNDGQLPHQLHLHQGTLHLRCNYVVVKYAVTVSMSYSRADPSYILLKPCLSFYK